MLLMRRVKNGEEYFVLPGGRVEENESAEQALVRELAEETSLEIKENVPAFEIENKGQLEKYFLIKDFTGTPALGGPEKTRMNPDNQYQLEWLELLKVSALKNFFPREAVNHLRALPQTHPSPEYYKAVPKKMLSAAILFFNEQGELLIVRPGYKPVWSLPGGWVDADESPRQTALRETKEEIGLEVTVCHFLGVSYTGGNGVGENVGFLFNGGVLSPEQIAKIQLDNDEIVDYKFVNLADAVDLLGSGLRAMLEKFLEAIKNNSAVYLEKL